MDQAVWQRRIARRWRLVGLVSFTTFVVMYVTGFLLAPLFGSVAILAAMRMSDGFGWADGYEARVAWAAGRMRDRVTAEAAAGAPAWTVATYAAVEAEHIMFGHDGDAGACPPCNAAGVEWVKQRQRELA